MDHLLERSQATDSFKNAVRAFLEGRDHGPIAIRGYAPRVKVERLLAKLLHDEPQLPIERVDIAGRSGCSDFTGHLVLETATSTTEIAFAWDCRWRAEQEGWTDYFGFPDQIRAAREYGWDCFQRWERRGESVKDVLARSAPEQLQTA